MYHVKSKIINQNEEWILYRPFNTQDVNYHLVNKKDKLDYLISINNVWEYEEIKGEEAFFDVLWEDLKELKNLDEALLHSWKVLEL